MVGPLTLTQEMAGSIPPSVIRLVMHFPTYESSGPLRYSYEPSYGYKLIVEVDKEIARLARALIPAEMDVVTPRYATHVTVVRREVPPTLSRWGEREGEIVRFLYETFVRNDERYWWLRVFSDDLAQVRHELGMAPYGKTTMAPDLKRCYHMTIGNTKLTARSSIS